MYLFTMWENVNTMLQIPRELARTISTVKTFHINNLNSWTFNQSFPRNIADKTAKKCLLDQLFMFFDGYPIFIHCKIQSLKTYLFYFAILLKYLIVDCLQRYKSASVLELLCILSCYNLELKWTKTALNTPL